MKRVLLQFSLVFFAACALVITFSLLARGEAAAATQDDCVAGGGDWAGSNSDFGVCSYPANSSGATQGCGADNTYVVNYNNDESVTRICTPVKSESRGPGYGGCGNEVRGPLPQPITISLCNHKNGSVTFPTGACDKKCTISHGLPAGPGRKLPGNAEATLYVRVVRPDGSMGDDSYVVCFSTSNLDLDPPAIYQFVGGQWRLLVIGNTESPVVCAGTAGDGAFYLGQPPKNSNG